MYKSSVILIIVLFSSLLSAESREEKQKRLTETWSKYFGSFDYSEDFVYSRLLYLKVQPLESFRDIGDIHVKKYPEIQFGMWCQEFFKGDLLKETNKLKPSKYYIRSNEHESSLLFYKTQIDDTEILLVENFTVLAITFRPQSFSIKEGIKKDVILDIIRKWIKIDHNMVDKFLDKDIYDKGVIFTTNIKKTGITCLRGWQDDILCFATEKGITFLYFKAYEDRPLIGIPFKKEWLDDIEQN